jgi:hypothetical protein
MTSTQLLAQRDMKTPEPVFNTAEMRCGLDAKVRPTDAEIKSAISSRSGIPANLLSIEVEPLPGFGDLLITWRVDMRHVRQLELDGVVTLKGGVTNPRNEYVVQVWMDELMGVGV